MTTNVTTNGRTPPAEAWQVASMRVTAFPSEAIAVEHVSWWADVVGVPPDTVVSRPKAGQYQAQGEFEGRQLAIQIQPGRTEWNIGPIVKAAEELPNVPMLGPLLEVIDSFSKVVTVWLPTAPPMTRLAFGTVLIQPVESVRAGYILIKKYLPTVDIDPEGSSDLLYQINRPRMSATGIQGLHINRLARWSVQRAQRVVLTLGPEGATTQTIGDEVACRLELDINTTPGFEGTLPVQHLIALVREMAELGREIAQRGDVP